MGKKNKNKGQKTGEAVAPAKEQAAAAPVATAKEGKRPFNKPSKTKAVELDDRFKAAMQAPSFQSETYVDKYGRQKTEKTDVSKLYNIRQQKKKEETVPEHEEKEEEEVEEEEEDEEAAEESEEEAEEDYDPARGVGVESSDEDEAVEMDLQALKELEEQQKREAEEEEQEGEVQPSKRLAVINLDWSEIRAVDILAIVTSFAPRMGAVLNVKVYPSEYGMKKMAHEDAYGPPKEIFLSTTEVKEGDEEEEEPEEEEDEEEEEEEEHTKKPVEKEDDEDKGFNEEELRRYELDRLKYFFGIIECDSVETAEAVFEACDGTEIWKSSNILDLRFVPDEQVFERAPRDVATEVPASYRPPDFYTKALQQTKLRLTWDETPSERKRVMMRDFSKDKKEEIDENDFKAYLASSASESSSSEEEEVADKNSAEAREARKERIKRRRDRVRKQYQTLLLNPDADGEDGSKSVQFDENGQPIGDMEITFTPGLHEAAEEVVKKHFEEKEQAAAAKELTPWEVYQQKRKDRKKLKKGLKDQNPGDDGEEAVEHSSDEELLIGRPEDKKKKQKKDIVDDEEEKKKRGELELLLMDEDVEDEDDEKAKKRKQKRESEKRKTSLAPEGAISGKKTTELDQNSSKLGDKTIADGRFGALLTSSDFAPDPTHPEFMDTPAMRKVIKERSVKVQEPASTEAAPAPQKRTASQELNSLAQSLKAKSSAFAPKPSPMGPPPAKRPNLAKQ